MNLTPDKLRRLAEMGLSMAQVIELVEMFASPERRQHSPTSASKKAGAARHGYTGPIEPRLSEEEWWPLRAAIIRRDDGVCAYCDDFDGKTLTADHIVPLSRGGSNEPWNLICCCVPCNNSKRDLLVTEWSGRSTTRSVKPFGHLVGYMTDASGGDPGTIRQ